MTTGERLVDISTLTTGTALEHFLNISTGTGEGTVYVERLLRAQVEQAQVSGEAVSSTVTGVVQCTELIGVVHEESQQADVEVTKVLTS